ncbi:MAG: glycosyltransferase [Agarilytica sp.]
MSNRKECSVSDDCTDRSQGSEHKKNASRTTQKKIKVLFVASDCNPEWHSLPALIAEYSLELSHLVELTLVTHIRNQAQIEPWLPSNIQAYYIDTEKFSAPLYRFIQAVVRDPNKAMTLQVALSVPDALIFEHSVWRSFNSALKNKQYDIVHRASPMSPTVPSYLASKCPVPFVVGPVLGGLPWPKEFKSEMRREGEWMNYLRKLHRFIPFYKSTYKNASAILAGYKHTVDDIPLKNRDTIFEFSEGAIHPQDYPEKVFDELGAKAPCTILFVGRMVPFKQPEILIRCFEKSLILQKHKLVMVGGGPEYPRLKALTEELNLGHCVDLAGALPHAEVRERMYKASIFAFPSIREQGGGVITMASMASLPSVVVDYGGPSFRVPPECGVRVPMSSVEGITERFVQALEGLVEAPAKREKLGRAARAFTEKYYSWEWKATKTLEIYQWVLGSKSEKPDYWADSEVLEAGTEEEEDIYTRAARISF